MEEQVILAAKNVLNLSREAAIANMEKLMRAPIMIVEYERLLPGESKRDYDSRRENIGVYTGEIKALVKYLSRINKKVSNGLLPWELIFTYAKKVNPDFLSGVEPEKSLSNSEEKSEGKQSDEAGEVIAATVEETVVEEASAPKEMEIHSDNSGETRETEEGVRVNKEQVTAKCDTKLEVPKMEGNQMNALEAAAAQIVTSEQEVKDAVAPATEEKAKKAKPEAYDKDVRDDVATKFQDTLQQRHEFVRNNNIKALIAATPSVKERLVVSENITGKQAEPGSATDPQKAVAEKLGKKLAGIVEKATGIVGMTYEKFAALDENSKYANCVTEEDKAMAKAIVNLLVTAQAKPDTTVSLAAPATNNVSYKGLLIGTTHYAKDELPALIIDHATESIYGENMIDADGNKTDACLNPETNVEVKITVKTAKASDKDSTKAGVLTVDARNSVSLVPVTVLKGRKVLIEQGKVVYCFPNIDKDTKKSAPLVVVIDGKPATFKYFKRDKDGNKIVIQAKTKKDGTVTRPAHDATQVASLKGCGYVFDTIKELPAELIGKDTRNMAASRWGVTLPKQESNNIFEASFDESKVFEIVTMKGVLSDGLKSDTIKTVQSIVSAKKQADAAVAGQTLGV